MFVIRWRKRATKSDEETHVAGEDYEVGLVPLERRDHLRLVRRPVRVLLVIERERRHA